MSFFGLSLAGSALSAFQEAANVTSDNITNANTPGASRQTVNLNEAPPVDGSPFYGAHFPGTLGDGVTVASVTRVHQDSYDVLYRGASSSQAFYQTQQQVLNATQSAFAEPNSGVNTALSGFQTAISTLAAQPQDAAARGAVISQAQALTSALNATASGIQTQEQQVLVQGASTVTKINGILDQIGDLNGKIRASKAVGDNPNTFSDQRDLLIDQLSQLISTQTSIQANGSTLVTVNGLALVNDQQVYHLAPPQAATMANGTQQFVVGFANDPKPSSPTAIPLGSGTLGALADLYNAKLQPYAQKLDGFASALANEVNRVTTAGYDQLGNAGSPLFVSSNASTPITAGNIRLGITDPVQVVAGLAGTDAGSLVASINRANTTVITSSTLNGNVALNNPPPKAGLTGTMTVSVDGTAQSFTYSTAAGGNATSVDAFVQTFNSQHFGVSASFDAPSQRIVFARDPNNTDPAHRALQGSNPTTPSFTISDSLQPAAATLAPGAAATSLLQALGAGAIAGVQQDGTNAYGTANNGAANALARVFTQNLGVPGYQLASTTGVTTTGTPVTVSLGLGGPSQWPNINVGDLITVDAAPGGKPENVYVTAIDKNAGTITAMFTQTHAAGFSIAAAPQQTLGAAYGSLVTKLGLDSQTASSGVTSQTNLASSIDEARQSVDGINVDEETQNLIRYQNAYQAAAHTVSVLDSLLNTVITTIGQLL